MAKVGAMPAFRTVICGGVSQRIEHPQVARLSDAGGSEVAKHGTEHRSFINVYETPGLGEAKYLVWRR